MTDLTDSMAEHASPTVGAAPERGARRLRERFRNAVPFAIRLEIARLRHMPKRALMRFDVARERSTNLDTPFPLSEVRTPLVREYDGASEARAKIENVRQVVRRIDGVILRPFQELSFHALVGRPSRLRGFRLGTELRDQRKALGAGGGMCKVSNLMYLLALRGGMRITERHRHGLDLFADAERAVPFGCGATVAYNYADLRFQNPFDQSVRVRLALDEVGRPGQLVATLLAERDPGVRVELIERDHRFFQSDERWFRENRIVRRFTTADGGHLAEIEEAHNVARVLYTPLPELTAGAEGGRERCDAP